MEEIKVKDLTYSDLDAVAAIHIVAFPKSFITKLGDEIARAYYQWQLDSPDEVYAIGAFKENKLLGFCFGGVFTMALGGFLSSNKLLVLKSVLSHPWILLNPYFFKKSLRGFELLMRFFKKDKIAHRNQEVSEDDPFGILAIATHPENHGMGIGKVLMNESEKYAVKHDFKKMLLSVSPLNLNAVQFYDRIGWDKVYDGKIWKGVMEKEILTE